MDITWLNEIPEADLDDLLQIGANLDLENGEKFQEKLDQLSRKEKIWCSKINMLVRNISQKHPADLKSFIQNVEDVNNNVITSLTKIIQQFHISENTQFYS